jgi:SCY1-like protein 2
LNVFAIVKASPSGKRVFTDKVIPRLRDIFLTQPNAKTPAERDTTKEAGLMVVLENMKVVADNCSGKEFRDGRHLVTCLSDAKSFANICRYPSHHRSRS